MSCFVFADFLIPQNNSRRKDYVCACNHFAPFSTFTPNFVAAKVFSACCIKVVIALFKFKCKEKFSFLISSCFCMRCKYLQHKYECLLEAKLPYDPSCPSVLLVDRSVFWSVCLSLFQVSLPMLIYRMCWHFFSRFHFSFSKV